MYRLLIAATLGADARATNLYQVECKIGKSSYKDALKCDWQNKGTYQRHFEYCHATSKEDSFYKTAEGLRKAPCGISSEIISDIESAALSSSELHPNQKSVVYPARWNEMTRKEKRATFPAGLACRLIVTGSEGTLYCHKIETKHGKCVNVVNKNQCGRGTMSILSNFDKDMEHSECKMKECKLNGSKSCSYDLKEKIWTGKKSAVARNGEKPECKNTWKRFGHVFRYAPGALCKNGVWVHEGTNEPITDEWDLCRWYWTHDDPEAAWNNPNTKYI